MYWHNSFLQFIFVFLSCINSSFLHSHEGEDYLLCRNCGEDVVKASDLTYFPSPLAVRQRNDTILGEPNVLIQLFRNPNGHQFEVITAEEARAAVHKQVYPADTWFKGYQWRMVVCQHCSVHLGWFYEPVGSEYDPSEQREEKRKSHLTHKGDSAEGRSKHQTFYGLILDKLIHQSYADSLLITPKFYGS